MKRAFLALSAAVVATALASPAIAQTAQGGATTTVPPSVAGPAIAPPNDHDTTRREVRRFDNFEDRRPEVAKELYKDPSLVNNPDYLAKHPGMQEWISKHPQAAEELKEHPKEFLARERNFDRRDDRYEHRDDRTSGPEAARFDKQFLDKHPEAAKDLANNPGLVNNKEWQEKHPGFRDYMKDHPNLREDIHEHPGRFAHKEHRFERWEHRHGDKPPQPQQ